MIKSDRHSRILALLDDCEALSVHEVARRLGRVSSVTVRRDVAELADRRLLLRTHGLVSRLDPPRPVPAEAAVEGEIGDVDAIVLPPIEGQGADTLRAMARRRHIPFLAESSQQDGGVYIGPDNFLVGRELGHRAGRHLAERVSSVQALLVSLERLPNTRSRCDGFIKGLAETFKGPIRSWRVDGRGSFRIARAAALDAFAAHPDINVAFGVNDHSILAALEASDSLGIDDVAGFSVGGEGSGLFDALAKGGKMRCCAALFPEIVGIRAVDVLAAALDGEAMPASLSTPHAMLTPATLAEYYQRDTEGWHLVPDARARLLPEPPPSPHPTGRRVIGFVPHYPAHDWYRNMIRAMRERADSYGHELRVAQPQAGIAREIQSLRRRIAMAAAERIRPGETLLINAGRIGLMLAEALAERHDITVVTNALDIMERLSGRTGLKLILTSGEYQARDRCLVGPSLGALFETLRVDRAFLSVDGVTARFGPSCADERMALAARRFAEAARETLVLADHSIVGTDAHHRILPMRGVSEVITDSGSLPADRLALAAAGVRVSIADEDEAIASAPTERGASQAATTADSMGETL
jgi:DeoR/GlpR family transcriptional regulator of sugar metabolism/ABC-type sugar transport system substrate-binding protein